MGTTTLQRQNIRSAFESMLRADYISISDLDALGKLDKYYVDIFNNVGNLLQRQDNYVSGRRGTGKTTLLFKGYFECLKTIAPQLKAKSEYFSNRKVLPIYIDLSNCNEIFSNNRDVDSMERYFVRQIIQSLKSQLETMFDERVLLIFKKENPALEDLEFIEAALVRGLTLKIDNKVSIQERQRTSEKASLGFDLSLNNLGSSGELYEENENEHNYVYSQLRGLDIQSFYNKIEIIRKKAQIDDIYVFLDEFSDLNEDEQKALASLLRKLLGSKINMYFKIGVITDRYDFGEKIIIGRDLFGIPLDLNEFVERFDGIVTTLKRMEAYIGHLIENRLNQFCPEVKYSDIFKIKKEEMIDKISKAAMGISRSVGMILQNAWIQAESSGSSEKRIGVTELNYGISATRRMYYRQFHGAIKSRTISGFYMDLWGDLIDRALSEKGKNNIRPASHFMIDPVRKDYLSILCENFLVFLLEDNRSSKYGGNYSLYCLNYDVCIEYGIIFAMNKDEFTAVRFVYDTVLSKYDPYFVKSRIKSYSCPLCGKIYDESELLRVKVKRCFDDDELLNEVIHKEAPVTRGNYAEVEIKILGLISDLDAESAMSAQEIADAVGCSRQKVSVWGSRVLHKKGLINIAVRNNKNYYFGEEFAETT